MEPPTNTNILLGGGSDTGPISFYHCRFHAHGPDLRRSVVMPVFVDILLDLAQQLTNQGQRVNTGERRTRRERETEQEKDGEGTSQ